MEKRNKCLRTLFIMMMLIVSSAIYSHKINGYKFIHIMETGNVYGIENKLSTYFNKIGFQVIDSSELDDMSNEDKRRLLIASYNWNIVYGGSSTLVLSLIDISNKVVYSTSGKGMAMSAKGDMSSALRKIFKQIDKLNYTYDPEIIKVKGTSSKYASWSEDSIKSYLKTKSYSSIEGVYNLYSNSSNYYKIAVLKDKETYYGVLMETDNSLWNRGDNKLVLNQIRQKAYDGEYYDYKGKKMVHQTNDVMLT